MIPAFKAPADIATKHEAQIGIAMLKAVKAKPKQPPKPRGEEKIETRTAHWEKMPEVFKTGQYILTNDLTPGSAATEIRWLLRNGYITKCPIISGKYYKTKGTQP